MIRVGVLGAAGRMGREVCRAVAAADDLELVAVVDPNNAGLEAEGLLVSATIESLSGADVDVAVDFTLPSAVMPNVRWCLRNGIHAVVGTTGLTPADLEELDQAAGAGDANCVVAPNFALGAVLLLRFAAEAARYFDAAEVIELHHDGKADAPSGTAIATARAIGAARAGQWSAPEAVGQYAGARGAEVEGVRVHAVRLARSRRARRGAVRRAGPDAVAASRRGGPCRVHARRAPRDPVGAPTGRGSRSGSTRCSTDLPAALGWVAVDYRTITDAEIDPFFGALAMAFADAHPDPEELRSDRMVLEPDRTFAAFDEGRIVGCAGVFTQRMVVPGGALVPTAGITLVGVLPTHRRRGILRELMQRMCAQALERGEVVTTLFASEAAIYGRFGFGAAAHHLEFDVALDRVRWAPDTGPDRYGRVAHPRRGDARDPPDL